MPAKTTSVVKDEEFEPFRQVQGPVRGLSGAERAMEKPERTPKTIGEALDLTDNIQRRVFKDLRDKVGEVQNVVRGLQENAKNRGDAAEESRMELNWRKLLEIYQGLDEATRSWTKTKEELEARKAYTDLQNKIIEGWPRSAVSDRLLYLGSGFIGGGGIAYAVLGPEAKVVYVVFWVVGIVALLWSLWGLAKYDRERGAYFSELLNRVR